MRIFLSGFFVFFFGMLHNASADGRVYKYDVDAINSSIKCELGKTSQFLARDRPDASRMKALVTISGEETTYVKSGVSIGFFIVNSKFNYESKTRKIRGAKGPRNIHPENQKFNCQKSFVVDVGVLDCFKEQRRRFLEGDIVTCGTEISATSSAEVDGKFKVWVVDAGPSGEISKARTWKVEIVAPPEK